MPGKIIKQLSFGKNKKNIGTLGLKGLIFLVACGLFSDAMIKRWDNHLNHKTERVLERIIQKDIKGYANNFIFETLKKNPNMIDRLPNEYHVLKRLDKVVFGEESTKKENPKDLERKLIIESENRIAFSDNPNKPYFSDSSIEKGSFWISEINSIFDPSQGTLYKINEKDQTLEKFIDKVKQISILSDEAYFIQGTNLFKRDKEGRITKEHEGKKNIKFYKLNNTPFGVLFEKGVNPILINSSNQENINELGSIVSKILSNMEKFKPDEFTKLIYEKESIYINRDYQLSIFSCDDEKRITLKKYDSHDFILNDVDNDGTNEILTLESNDLFSSRYFYYKYNQEGEVLSKLKCGNPIIKISENYQTVQKYFSPNEFKRKLKKGLIKK